jgi:hypothetical protein
MHLADAVRKQSDYFRKILPASFGCCYRPRKITKKTVLTALIDQKNEGLDGLDDDFSILSSRGVGAACHHGKATWIETKRVTPSIKTNSKARNRVSIITILYYSNITLFIHLFCLLPLTCSESAIRLSS